jgi:hypothetical protein
MVDFVSVTSLNGDGSLGLHARFKLKADADDHAEIHSGWVAADPGGDPDHWRIDANNKTITLDDVGNDAYQAALNVKGLAAERRRAYAPIGDQLDNMTKVLKILKAGGVDVGSDGDAQIAMSDAVKAAHPKP